MTTSVTEEPTIDAASPVAAESPGTDSESPWPARRRSRHAAPTPACRRTPTRSRCRSASVTCGAWPRRRTAPNVATTSSSSATGPCRPGGRQPRSFPGSSGPSSSSAPPVRGRPSWATASAASRRSPTTTSHRPPRPPAATSTSASGATAARAGSSGSSTAGWCEWSATATCASARRRPPTSSSSPSSRERSRTPVHPHHPRRPRRGLLAHAQALAACRRCLVGRARAGRLPPRAVAQVLGRARAARGVPAHQRCAAHGLGLATLHGDRPGGGLPAGRQARYHELRYESLVRAPLDEGERILDFLGITAPASRDRFLTAVQRADDSSVGTWRSTFYPSELAEIEAEAGDLLRRLGYAD